MMKQILFNTPMVQSLLRGDKTQTRRDPFRPPEDYPVFSGVTTSYGQACAWFSNRGGRGRTGIYGRFTPGDILYVRETWAWDGDEGEIGTGTFVFRADHDAADYKWHPSIHMPKEAARLFLRVTDVGVERLQKITEAGAIAEGCTAHGGNLAVDEFEEIWQKTLKGKDLDLYGWAANPWVWVYTFQRISKEAAEICAHR